MPPLLLYRSYHATGMTTDGIAVKGLNLKLPLLNQEKHRDHVRGWGGGTLRHGIYVEVSG